MSNIESTSDQHVVILINYMRRHHVLAFREFAEHVGKLTILVSTPMEGDRAWDPEWEGLDVIVQKNSTLTLKRSSGFDEKNFIHFPWDTLWQLRKLKPDVILSYEMGMRTLLCSFFRRFNRNIPLVMVCNMSTELEKKRGLVRRSIRKFLKSSVDFCTYNGPVCKKYLTSIGIDESNLIYFPYCFDREKTFSGEKKFSPNGVKRLLFCGALSERKAVLPFVKILSEYCQANPDREIEFQVAGDGPFRDQVSGLNDRNLSVLMLGNCGPDQLRDCYSQADVCVFPSLGDEWGLVPMEAWASGVPVLGSRYSQSVKSLCKHGENGWVFDSKSETDTRKVMDEVMGVSSRRLTEMSVQARDVVKNFSPKESAERLRKVICRALLKNGKNR